jgi:hypothetical protein
MAKTIDEILVEKADARLRLYAYVIDAETHKGLIKVGQTTRDVRVRVEEQTKTANIRANILLDVPGEKADGTPLTDHQVRTHLIRKGFENPALELSLIHI